MSEKDSRSLDLETLWLQRQSNTLFCWGVCVSLELQPEPPAQQQLLFCFPLRDLRPKEGRGGVLFHGLDMLSSFLLPRGSQRTL